MAAVAQSEQHFRLLVEGVTDYAIFMLDPAGYVVSWNPGAERIKGYHAGEIIGQHFSRFYPDEDVRAGKPEHGLHIAAAEGRFEGEGWRVRKDGSLFWANVLITALRDEAGQLRGFAKVTRDLTERRRAEEALRASEERFRVTFAQAPVGIGHAAPEGRWLLVNRRLCDIVGYSRDELLARTLQDITYPEDLEADLARVRKVFAGELQTYAIEKRYIHRDGSLVWVNQTVSLVRDAAGAPSYLIAVVEDIRERKRAEAERADLLVRERQARADAEHAAEMIRRLQTVTEAALAQLSLDNLLRELLSRIRTMLEADTAAILLIAPEGDRLALRAAVGLEEDTNGTSIPIGKGFAGRIAAEHRPISIPDIEHAEILRPVLRERGIRSLLGAPLAIEGRVIGVIHVGSLHRREFSENDIHLLQLVADRAALAIDRARLYEAERRYTADLERRVAERTASLQEVNAELEAFAYSVSHDLRAPLRAMQGFAEALLEDYGDALNDLGRDYARRIVEASEQMDDLIRDLLAYSRLGRAELSIQAVNLDAVVADALARVEPELRAHNAEVRVTRPLPWVHGHYATLVQVVANLLANAAKFVPPGRRPSVRLWAEEIAGDGSTPTVRLWVEDNGIGIAPEHRERIFRVFERLHGSESYPGTGIGLALVRKGLERMGGRVGVEPVELAGSRFWVELPKGNIDEC